MNSACQPKIAISYSLSVLLFPSVSQHPVSYLSPCLCAHSRSGKVFGSPLPKSGWLTSVKSESLTPTFCTRLQTDCSGSLCTPRANRWEIISASRFLEPWSCTRGDHNFRTRGFGSSPHQITGLSLIKPIKSLNQSKIVGLTVVAMLLLQLINIDQFWHPQLDFPTRTFSLVCSLSPIPPFFLFLPFTTSHMNVNKARRSIRWLATAPRVIRLERCDKQFTGRGISLEM